MATLLRYQARCDYLGRWVIIDTVKPDGENIVDSSHAGLTLDDILGVTHDKSKLAAPDYERIHAGILQRSRNFRLHCEENRIGPEQGEI
jgi:hypothetical protein